MIYNQHIYVGVNLSGGTCTAYELPGDEAKVVPTTGGILRDNDCFMMRIPVTKFCDRV